MAERETNPKAANKALMGLKGDSRAGSRRGSCVPRSRGGSIQLGGAERRGSYYEEGVTQRATVAMVTDDPEHKKNVKAGLAGAFDDAAIKNGTGQSNGVMTNGDHAGDVLGDLPADASEEEIAKRLAAAGITGDAAKQMMAAVKGGGPNMEEMRERKDTFEMPEIPNVAIPELREGAVNGVSNGVSGVTMREGGGRVKRGSIKRQSEILRDQRKSRQEEREEERKRKESYFRKVTGLRKAKVPLMVYSCGGFSRCFRIARFYDLEGPPVGVEYSKPGEGDDRRALNPEF